MALEKVITINLDFKSSGSSGIAREFKTTAKNIGEDLKGEIKSALSGLELEFDNTATRQDINRIAENLKNSISQSVSKGIQEGRRVSGVSVSGGVEKGEDSGKYEFAGKQSVKGTGPGAASADVKDLSRIINTTLTRAFQRVSKNIARSIEAGDLSAKVGRSFRHKVSKSMDELSDKYTDAMRGASRDPGKAKKELEDVKETFDKEFREITTRMDSAISQANIADKVYDNVSKSFEKIDNNLKKEFEGTEFEGEAHNVSGRMKRSLKIVQDKLDKLVKDYLSGSIDAYQFASGVGKVKKGAVKTEGTYGKRLDSLRTKKTVGDVGNTIDKQVSDLLNIANERMKEQNKAEKAGTERYIQRIKQAQGAAHKAIISNTSKVGQAVTSGNVGEAKRLASGIKENFSRALKVADVEAKGLTTTIKRRTNRQEKIEEHRIAIERRLSRERDKVANRIQHLVETSTGKRKEKYKKEVAKMNQAYVEQRDIFRKMLKQRMKISPNESVDKLKDAMEHFYDDHANRIQRAGAEASEQAKKIGASRMKEFGRYTKGAVGFGSIEIGQRLTQIAGGKRMSGFLGSRMRGSVTGATSFLGPLISGMIGDMANAGGTAAEMFLNSFTRTLRMTLVGVGGFIKGLGYSVASGIFSQIGTVFTGGMSTLLKGVTGVAMGAVMSAVSLVQEMVDEMITLVKNLVEVITSLISAGAKLWAAVFKGVLKTIGQLWKGLWVTIKNVVTNMKDAVVSLSKLVGGVLVGSMKRYIELQSQAAGAATELADKHKNATGIFIKLINSIQRHYGVEMRDAAEAVFNVVSAGFRSIAEAGRITAAAARLGLAAESNLETATNTLIVAYKNWGKAGETIYSVEKKLATAATLGVTKLSEFGPAFRNVAGMASRAKIPLDDTLASLVMMTRVFGRGNAGNAARFLNRLIEAVTMPRGQGVKALEEIGFDFLDFANDDASGKLFELIDKLDEIPMNKWRNILPTIQSRKAVAALTKDLEEYKEILSDSKKLEAVYAKQVRIKFFTLERQIARLKGSMSTVGTFIGETLNRAFAKPFFKIVSIVDKFITKLSDSKEFMKFLAIFAKKLRFSLSPILDPVYDAFEKIYEITKDMENMKVDDFAKAIFGSVDNADKFFEWIFIFSSGLKTFLIETGNFFKNINSNFKKLKENIDFIGTGFKRVKKFLDEISEPGGFDEKISNMFNTINSMVNNVFQPKKMWSRLQDIDYSPWESFAMKLGDILYETLKTAIASVFTWAVQAIVLLFSRYKSFMTSELGIKDVFNIKNLFKEFTGVSQKFHKNITRFTRSRRGVYDSEYSKEHTLTSGPNKGKKVDVGDLFKRIGKGALGEKFTDMVLGGKVSKSQQYIIADKIIEVLNKKYDAGMKTRFKTAEEQQAQKKLKEKYGKDWMKHVDKDYPLTKTKMRGIEYLFEFLTSSYSGNKNFVFDKMDAIPPGDIEGWTGLLKELGTETKSAGRTLVEALDVITTNLLNTPWGGTARKDNAVRGKGEERTKTAKELLREKWEEKKRKAIERRERMQERMQERIKREREQRLERAQTIADKTMKEGTRAVMTKAGNIKFLDKGEELPIGRKRTSVLEKEKKARMATDYKGFVEKGEKKDQLKFLEDRLKYLRSEEKLWKRENEYGGPDPELATSAARNAEWVEGEIERTKNSGEYGPRIKNGKIETKDQAVVSAINDMKNSLIGIISGGSSGMENPITRTIIENNGGTVTE